jgi:hypothetical protein
LDVFLPDDLVAKAQAQRIYFNRPTITVITGILNILKIRRKLRIVAELDAIISFEDLLQTVIELAVTEEESAAARSQIITMLR